MSHIDRRSFLRMAATLGAGGAIAPSIDSLSRWSRVSPQLARELRSADNGGLGPLVQSPDCPELWIPEGFRVVRLSRSRQPSIASPAFIVPNAMDGMAAFPLPNGDVRLIRNHEMANSASRAEPLGKRPYDALASGGTVSLTVRIEGSGSKRDVRVLEEFVSLSGTHINCAGGRTPWGSWLSCEETTAGPGYGFGRSHGYIFEVPASAREEIEPVPLRAMGRMVHEAVAVDPRTSIVYETEDMRWSATNAALPGAGFYRFIPRTRERLVDGGRLQILAVRNRPQYNTVLGQTLGARLDAHWIDIESPDPEGAEETPSAVFREGLKKGGAIFDRLEGCFWADDSCYFVSTSGGTARAGQIWRYVPESDDEGKLLLAFESPSRDVLDGPDNICVSSRGGVVICEDGNDDQFIRMLTKKGEMLDLVQQPLLPREPEPREFAGCCFSPNGEVLFFNIQGARTSDAAGQGATYALWGEWVG